MDDSPPAIAERIRQAREQAGMTQDALAEQLGVSKRQVYGYESGETKPYAKLDRIAKATGVSKQWLLTGFSVEERLERLEDEREDLYRMLNEINQSVRELLRPPAGLLPPDESDLSTSQDPDARDTDEDPPPPAP